MMENSILTDDALWDILDGLMAYDVGATDSGIHDADLRARAGAAYAAMDDVTRTQFLYDHLGGRPSDDRAEAIMWLGDLKRGYSTTD